MLTYERDVHSGILFPTDAEFHMYFYSNELAFLLSIAKENTHKRIESQKKKQKKCILVFSL